MVLAGPGKVLPPVIGASLLAYAMYVAVDRTFGSRPRTLTSEWSAATQAMRDAWPCTDSGAEPVKLNPIGRGADP
uniref:Uncharacterized protein n=1 Tax=Tetraselmis sp. GSL018 TaxID=582737 RepID=A0A061RJL3_9CHLO|eukprot:CAMPEP_0177583230 /NCGR_PEP_ID=MMETSP0419_2-20121207/3205_1 /TAXON_ID=582737 /ORGANISM="Tetraselmis sp., Strain GSL018" /LENGTH=74 /DNA_ID=CAMNT_0019072595 /DNA_START=64 /DNA_END=288 /DNA_ORIENTATION=+